MPVPPLSLVGRETEVDLLHSLMKGCRDGRSAILALIGEAGVGKSRLLTEARLIARLAEVRVIPAVFSRGEEDIPLASLRRGLVGLPRSDARDRLEKLFSSDAPRDVRYQMVEYAIAAVMDIVEDRHPMTFLVEDAHWADRESLQVLRAVARRTVDRGVAVVLTARPVPRSHGLSRLLGMDGITRTVRELRRLDEAALAEMTYQAFGAFPGPRLSGQLRRTAGNALIATELLDEINRTQSVTVADGVAELGPDAEVRAPDLARHVANRMQGLSTTARQVAILVALSDLTPIQLARLLDTTVSAVAGPMEEVVADGLVMADHAVLSLRHDLLRRAVLAEVSPAVRAGLHADLFRLFSDELSRDEGGDMARLAPHVAAAGNDPANPGDLKGLAAAGRGLLTQAPAVAASLLRRAVEGGLGQAQVDLAFALILLGDVSGARQILDGNGLENPGGPEQAQARLAMAQLDFLNGDLRSASSRFEAVSSHLPRPAANLALADAAISSLMIGQLERSQRLALSAGTAKPDRQDRAATGTGLMVRGWIWAARGQLDRGLALSRAGHLLATSAPMAAADPNLPDFFLAQMLLWDERPAEAASAVDRGMHKAEQLGMSWHLASLHAIQAEIETRRGNWDDAEAQLDTALALAEDVEVQHGVPFCLAAKARIAIGRGQDVDAILVRTERVVARLGGQGADLMLWMRGLNHLTSGRHAEACQVLGFLWGRLERAGMVLRQVQIATDLLRAAQPVDQRRTDVVHDWLTDTADRLSSPRLQAVATHARGLRNGEVRLIENAAVMLTGLGDPMEAARMTADALALGADVDAAVHQAAISVLEGAGAGAWIRSALGQATLASRPPSGWSSLTPAQARIVHRVGQGLSNADIAAELSVSRRTVESHLYHAYPKLDVESRVQLSLAAARHINEGWEPDGL